jgi:hypothetical protein
MKPYKSIPPKTSITPGNAGRIVPNIPIKNIITAIIKAIVSK